MNRYTTLFALSLIVVMCGMAAAGSCCGDACEYTPAITPSKSTQCTGISGGMPNIVFPFNPAGCAELPRLPHEFGGCVYIDGVPAPAGTLVCVSGQGVTGTCMDIGANGCFGQGTFDPKLMVTGIAVPGGMINAQEGTDLSFYVNNQKARVCVGSYCGWTVQFHSGHYTSVVLTLTTTEPCCDAD